jgi:hypothetical protein
MGVKKSKSKKDKNTSSVTSQPTRHRPYTVSLEKFYTTELAEIEKWCDQTFTSWYRTGVFPGYIHFAEEQHVTMFLLRWAR